MAMTEMRNGSDDGLINVNKQSNIKNIEKGGRSRSKVEGSSRLWQKLTNPQQLLGLAYLGLLVSVLPHTQHALYQHEVSSGNAGWGAEVTSWLSAVSIEVLSACFAHACLVEARTSLSQWCSGLFAAASAFITFLLQSGFYNATVVDGTLLAAILPAGMVMLAITSALTRRERPSTPALINNTGYKPKTATASGSADGNDNYNSRYSQNLMTKPAMSNFNFESYDSDSNNNDGYDSDSRSNDSGTSTKRLNAVTWIENDVASNIASSTINGYKEVELKGGDYIIQKRRLELSHLMETTKGNLKVNSTKIKREFALRHGVSVRTIERDLATLAQQRMRR